MHANFRFTSKTIASVGSRDSRNQPDFGAQQWTHKSLRSATSCTVYWSRSSRKNRESLISCNQNMSVNSRQRIDEKLCQKERNRIKAAKTRRIRAELLKEIDQEEPLLLTKKAELEAVADQLALEVKCWHSLNEVNTLYFWPCCILSWVAIAFEKAILKTFQIERVDIFPILFSIIFKRNRFFFFNFRLFISIASTIA